MKTVWRKKTCVIMTDVYIFRAQRYWKDLDNLRWEGWGNAENVAPKLYYYILPYIIFRGTVTV